MQIRTLALCVGCVGIVALNGCCDKPALSRNTTALSSGNAGERNRAALALARCGSDAKAAVPRLIALLYDDNVGVQSSAAYALRQIDTPDARKAMQQVDEARRKARQ